MKSEIGRKQINTKCPYCSKEITAAWVVMLESVVGIRYAYFCSNCQKNLGVFHEEVIDIPSNDILRERNKNNIS